MSTQDQLMELGTIINQEKFNDYSREIMFKTKGYNRKSIKKESEKMILKNQVFEGTLVAAGWDKRDHVSQSSLYTQDDEDILLEHNLGIEKFKPYMNQKVRISGDIISTAKDGRRVLVKKISRLTGFTKPIVELRDEFDNLLTPEAA